MLYYKFKWSLDTKIVGRSNFPQTDGLYETTVDNPDYIFNAFRNHKKVDREVLIPKARLRMKSTKLTDLLSSGGYGFSGTLLMSDKLKSSIENSKQIGIQFFSTTVYDFSGEKSFPYWLGNVYVFFPEYIDYARSEVLVTSMDGKRKEQLLIDTYEDFQHKESLLAPREFKINKVALLENKIEHDFFALNKMDDVVSYFVSEKLKNEMEKAGCTGIDFIEV